MIEIYMKNITSKILNLPIEVEKLLLINLSYEEKGFGVKSERKFLYNVKTKITYTGLIPKVIIILNKLKLKYQLYDMRERPEANGNFKINKNFSPRDYQEEIINNVSSREVVQAATGAGKTFIMANLIAKFNVKPVVVIAPKVSLAKQIQEEFEKFLEIPIGIIGGGYNDIKDITVCTPMSAPDNLLEQCKMILYDEYHLCVSHTIFKTGIKAKNAYYRFGMSATPWREDGKDILLEAIMNIRKPKLSINASKLIDKGKLTPCTINFIPIKQIFDWPGNYNSLYKEAIVNNENRNNVIINITTQKFYENKSIIILIKNIKHGMILLNELAKNVDIKNKIKLISGSNDLDERNNILKDVKNGKIKILIASTIADEGLDCPILDTLILAGGGKSSTKAFQRVGRVLRLYPGKTIAEVYDFKDYTPTLYNHYQYRKALYETENRWKIKD